MNFAENLKEIRRQKNLSQEELAELLDVSRQAVSKWEQGQGYPEVETLLELSRKLNVSLDSLMGTAPLSKEPEATAPTGSISITSPHENTIVRCYKVTSTGKMKGREDEPKYALFGVSEGYVGFWGQPTTFLGWYADEESIKKEVEAIQSAIMSGSSHYTLQYSVKTEQSLFRRKIVKT